MFSWKPYIQFGFNNELVDYLIQYLSVLRLMYCVYY